MTAPAWKPQGPPSSPSPTPVTVEFNCPQGPLSAGLSLYTPRPRGGRGGALLPQADPLSPPVTCGASSLGSISFCDAEGGFAKIISKRATWKSVHPGGTGISVARILRKQQLWCWCVSPCPPAHLGRHRLPAGSSPLSLPPGHPEWPPLLLVFEVRAFSRGSASGSRYHTPPSRRPASSRRRGGELMGSLQARPLRFGGGSVLTGPGAWTAAWGESGG